MKGLVKLKKKKFILFLPLFLSLILTCVVLGCSSPNSGTSQLPAQQTVANTPQIKVTSIDTASGPKALTEPISNINWEKVEKTEPAKAEPAIANPQPKEELAPSSGAEIVPPVTDYLVTINLDSNKLTQFKNGVKAVAYPVATGAIVDQECITPAGQFVI